MKLPSVGTEIPSTPRRILASPNGAQFLPGGKIISGANSRDSGNTGYLDTLRAGMVMGKRSLDNKYAPSILGLLTTKLAVGGASAIVSAAQGDEVARRVVAGGTFKIVGAPGAAIDEVQTFTTNAVATGGTFRISYKGDQTAPIAYDATATEVNTAIALLEGISAGDIVMTAGDEIDAATTIVMTLLSTLGPDIEMLSWDIDGITGGTTTIEGVRTTKGEQANVVKESRALSFSAEAAGTITLAANSAVAEVQTATIDAVATAGTWTITFDGETTAAIAFDATQTEINAAMDALSNLPTAGCVLTAGDEIDTATSMVFTFADTLGNVPILSIDISGLTGPTTISWAETTPGELVAYAITEQTFEIGSMLMPLDGSEKPMTLISDETGVKVSDENATVVDVQYHRMLIAGQIAAKQMLLYPTDGPTQIWLKEQLNANGGHFIFDDDF